MEKLPEKEAQWVTSKCVELITRLKECDGDLGTIQLVSEFARDVYLRGFDEAAKTVISILDVKLRKKV